MTARAAKALLPHVRTLLAVSSTLDVEPDGKVLAMLTAAAALASDEHGASAAREQMLAWAKGYHALGSLNDR